MTGIVRFRFSCLITGVCFGVALLAVGVPAAAVPAFAATAPPPPPLAQPPLAQPPLARPPLAQPPAGATSETGSLNLSVGVDDGRTAAQEGDSLTYTVRVRNLGTAPAAGLVVTQSFPDSARIVSADRDGTVAAKQVTWRTDLATGQDTAFVVRAQVDKPPAELLRLASVACVATAAAGRPLVCAADSDILPAGAKASPAAASHRTDGPDIWGTVRYVLGGGAAALVAVVVLVLFRRRRPPRPPGRRHTVPPTAPDGAQQMIISNEGNRSQS